MSDGDNLRLVLMAFGTVAIAVAVAWYRIRLENRAWLVMLRREAAKRKRFLRKLNSFDNLLERAHIK